MSQSDVYFPDINQKSNSIRTTRSDPSYLEYTRGRRLIYEKNVNEDCDFQGKLRRQTSSDKIVTFYRDFESTHPEIRLMISEHRFRDVHHLVDDLSKLIQLRSQEKYIHDAQGRIVRSLKEFENGGIYFFGPPHVYHVNDYYRFREQNTPDLLDSEEDEGEKTPRRTLYSPMHDDYYKWIESKKSKRKRHINIISNVTTKPLTFLVDETQHRSMTHVLQDVSEMLLPQYDRVEKLCTRKGVKVRLNSTLYNSVYYVICNSRDSFREATELTN